MNSSVKTMTTHERYERCRDWSPSEREEERVFL
jgi:hypothetical protein